MVATTDSELLELQECQIDSNLTNLATLLAHIFSAVQGEFRKSDTVFNLVIKI